MNLLASSSANKLPANHLTLAEATTIIIEETPGLFSQPSVAAFLHQGRHLAVRAWEGLAFYYKAPETTDKQHCEIIEGCLLYLHKFEKVIKDDEGAASKNALSNFTCLAGDIAHHTPDLAIQKLLPPVRELAEHFLLHAPQSSTTQSWLEAMSSLDKRDWALQRNYWVGLLDNPNAAGYAFNHVILNDPQSSALDAAIPNILCAKLRGTISTNALSLLADLAGVRDNPTELLANTLNAVPDELQSKLIEMLDAKKFSKDWIRYLPVRTTRLNTDKPIKSFGIE